MAGLLYAIESSKPLTRAALGELGFPFTEAAGLPGREAAIDGVGACYVFKLTDPCQPGGEAPVEGYYPEQQTWKVAAGGKWRIGWYNDRPPTPCDLQRKALTPGYELTLRDGNLWTIPVVRQLEGTTGLPRVYGLTDEGEMGAMVAPEYHRLYDLGWQIWNTLGKDQEPMTYEELVEAVALALSVNYLLGREELLALGLTTDHELTQAVKMIVDLPRSDELIAEQKKKEDHEHGAS